MKRQLPIMIGVGLILTAGGWFAGTRWGPVRPPGPPAAREVGASESAAGAAPDRQRVTLTEAKRAAARIEIVKVEKRSFQHFHPLPGRTQYDDTRHVEIKAATDGVLKDCFVKPGDQVTAGQVLVVLSSPEVGSARADLLKRESELKIAMHEYQWRQDTCRNVEELAGEIGKKRQIDELEKQFAGRPLGDHRQTLMTAYSRLLLAESMLSSIHTATEAGALAARTVRERSSERQTSDAALRAACEQTVFDTRQELAAAQATLEDARRRLDIARQHVTALLGYDETTVSETLPVDSQAEESDALPANLSLVETRAPFAGTIERKIFSVSERVRQGETMLVLADTTRLWVAADIRDSDWPALNLDTNQELSLEFPALPGRKFTGRLYYRGREVEPDTNAVPLVAIVENPDGALRPGMFVRVSVPLGPPREALVVPAAAVVEHEGAKFVFQAESPQVFRRVDVRTGEQTADVIEVVEGLAENVPIVAQGAFLLKSELLLEREE